MPTMKDVAREARVSLGTVSNVLNNLPSVLPENRERVLAAVKKLGFRSNMAARTLRTKTTQNIGLIIPNISNPFFPELARSVEDTALQFGLTVFLCNDDRNREKERNYLNALINKNVDGIILVKPQISLEEVDEVRACCPIVLVDMETPIDSGYDVINIADEPGVTAALELLIGYGHQRIALIDGMNERSKSQHKSDVFARVLQAHGIAVRREYLQKGGYDWQSGYLACNVLLRLPEPPTAIFAINDLMAIGAMKAIQERGLGIPKDISVVGFDNIELTSLYTPALTTVNFPKYEVGCKSVELLLECMKEREAGLPPVARRALFATELVLRESAGKPPFP